jgi:2-methylcitrate dehydratase PrpD
MAVGFFDRRAGFQQFTEARIHDPAVLSLARKIRYEIDPDNPSPKAFTGHLRASLRDGTTQELAQAHMRGGAHAPLSAAEFEGKFIDNAIYGGWTEADASNAKAWCARVFTPGAIAEAARLRK